MNTQTIHNPATGQIQVIDLSQPNAQQQIMSYYQQGWTSAPPAISPSIPKLVAQSQQQQAQQQELEAIHSQYTQNVQQARVNIAEREKSILTPEQQELKDKYEQGIKVPISEAQYNKLGPEAKKYYKIAPKVSEREYAQLGDRTRRDVEVQPTTMEKVAGVAETVAIMAVPFYDTIKNWDKKDTKQKIFSIALDAVSIIPSAWVATRTVSATVRAGGTIRAGVQTAIKNEILAPYYMARHPIETFKAPFVTLKEFVSKKYVPYEGVIGSIKAPAGRVGMSDVRMRVGAGLEEAGATREAMEALQRQVVAGELKPSTMQGLSKVELTPTGIQQALGDGIALSGSPAFENYLTALEATGKVSKGKVGLQGAMLGKETDILSPGHILVQGKEGGIYTAGTGTLFHKGAATGGTGQISVQLAIDTAGKGLGELPKAVGKYQDISQMHKAGVRVLGAGKADDALVPGFKIYAGTAEGEMVVQNLEKLYAVPSGKLTTFKWNIPEPTLMKKAESMRDTLKATIVELGDAKKAGASSTRLKALEDKATELAEQVLKTEKEAIKKGTPKSVTLDIDHVKIIDPMTGEETIVAHFAVEGANAKPWTQAQINALKRRGYLNMPRDITTPALKYPHMTPEEQFSLIRARLNPSESARMDAGLELTAGLSNQKVSTGGLKIDLKKVDILQDMPDKTINSIENVFRSYKDKTRLHGSLVEQTYTGKTIAGDLDVAADMGIMQDATKKVAKAIEGAGYKTRIRMISAEQGLGGAGFGVDFYKDGKWVKAVDFRDMAEHKKLLAYGMQTHDAVPINGIYLETPREMLNRRLQVMLMPGFGLQGAEYIGPQAAFKLNRMKDIPRAQMLTDNLLDAMHTEAMSLSGEARQAKLVEEARLRQAARTLFGDTPTPGKPLTVPELRTRADIYRDIISSYSTKLAQRGGKATAEQVEALQALLDKLVHKGKIAPSVLKPQTAIDYLGDFTPSEGYKILKVSRANFEKVHGAKEAVGAFTARMKLRPGRGAGLVEQNVIVIKDNSSALDLAHEIGHALHNDLRGLPKLGDLHALAFREASAQTFARSMFGRRLSERDKGRITSQVLDMFFGNKIDDMSEAQYKWTKQIIAKQIDKAEAHTKRLIDNLVSKKKAFIKTKAPSSTELNNRLSEEYDDYFKNFIKASNDIDVYDTIRQIENRVQVPYDKRYKGPLRNLASIRASNPAMRNILTVADGEYRGLRTESVTPSRMEPIREERLQRDDRVTTGGGIPRDERIERAEREEVVPREERVDRIERPPVEPRVSRPPREERPPDTTRISRIPRETRVPDEPRTPRPPREERIPDEPRPPKKGEPGIKAGLRIVDVEGIPKRPGIVQYDMGISRVKAKPPYRPGTQDIDFEHLKEPTQGKGSEQATLRVYDGDAPQKLVLGHGWKRTSILRGEELHNTVIKPQGRGIVKGLDGRVRKSRRKGIMRM